MRQQNQIQYHAFTTKYQALVNRIITSAGVSTAFDIAAPPATLPVMETVQALWDTGATASVVTESTAQKLQLIPTGVVNINHAGGFSQSPTYVVNIHLPNNVVVMGVSVSQCPDNAGNFGLIIGMDVISGGDFAITNMNGSTLVSFCYPSGRVLDFVNEINRQKYAGIGRNDPCPCGKQLNGKTVKYKNCHGR